MAQGHSPSLAQGDKSSAAHSLPAVGRPELDLIDVLRHAFSV